jgi:hypothetical protein
MSNDVLAIGGLALVALVILGTGYLGLRLRRRRRS